MMSSRKDDTHAYYRLILKVDPGGARYDRELKTSSIEEIKLAVIEFIHEEMYLFCWYGCKMYLDVYHAGESLPRSQYDLRAIISVYIPRLKTIIKYNQHSIVYYSSENGKRYCKNTSLKEAVARLAFDMNIDSMVIKGNGDDYHPYSI